MTAKKRSNSNTNRLTATFVRQTREPGVYVDGNGLRFQITASGGRRWFIRVTTGGQRKDIALGSADMRSLQEVRELAVLVRRAVADGCDPMAITRPPLGAPEGPFGIVNVAITEIAKPTFRDAWNAYWELKKPQISGPSARKNQTFRERQMETYVLPWIGDRPVAEIAPTEILQMLSPIWTTKEETARRVLQRVDSVFVSAIMRQWRIGVSPCVGVGRELGAVRFNKTNRAALAWKDVPNFLVALRERGGLVTSRLALEFLVLNANRSGEVRGAVWTEFDLDARTWNIPAKRMKMKREHIIPLSPRAIEILRCVRSVAPDSALVFPGTKGQILSDMTLTKRLRDMGLGDTATVHGFRSSFKDYCAEHSIRDEVSEAALAHIDKNQVRAAYLRTNFFEQRVDVMTKWEAFCCSRS
jgi:integrase